MWLGADAFTYGNAFVLVVDTNKLVPERILRRLLVIRCFPMGSSGWRGMAAFPLAPRSHEAAVWTGDELIVWGGKGPGPLGDGARYDPKSDRWTPMSDQGAPARRWLHGAAWTGTELAVWGGANEADEALADGGLYDPAADAWRPIADFEREGERVGRNCAQIAWTGSELLVWGGLAEGCDVGLGGLYDPQSEAWRPLTEEGQPTRRHDHAFVWTGTRLLVWGGMAGDKSSGDGTGGIYDPEADQWSPIAQQGAPKPRMGFVSLWTGDALLVWGGRKGGKTYPADGGCFDPTAGTWQPIKRSKVPGPRVRAASAWTGDCLLVWGGTSPKGVVLGDGAAFDLAKQKWAPLPAEGAPSPRSLSVGVWTGTELIVWGGQARHDELYQDGAIYAS